MKCWVGVRAVAAAADWSRRRYSAVPKLLHNTQSGGSSYSDRCRCSVGVFLEARGACVAAGGSCECIYCIISQLRNSLRAAGAEFCD